MKTLERLLLSYLRPRVRTYMDPLQFASQPYIVDDEWMVLSFTCCRGPTVIRTPLM